MLFWISYIPQNAYDIFNANKKIKSQRIISKSTYKKEWTKEKDMNETPYGLLGRELNKSLVKT